MRVHLEVLSVATAWVCAHKMTHVTLPPTSAQAAAAGCQADGLLGGHHHTHARRLLRGPVCACLQQNSHPNVHQGAQRCTVQALLSIVHVLSSSRIIFGAVPHAKSCFVIFSLATRCIGGCWVTTAGRRMHMICGRLCRGTYCRSRWCRWTDPCTHTNLNMTEGQLLCMPVLMGTSHCTVLLQMMRAASGSCGLANTSLLPFAWLDNTLKPAACCFRQL